VPVLYVFYLSVTVVVVNLQELSPVHTERVALTRVDVRTSDHRY